jgi:hypothetical protein
VDWKLKEIIRTPLEELWTEAGPLEATPGEYLDEAAIVRRLQAGKVQFVMATIGGKPEWIPLDDCFRYWKNEVKPHLADPDSRVSLNEYDQGYCYFARLWSVKDAADVVVLEMHH